jgi:UDP-glucuronate decarboxylase
MKSKVIFDKKNVLVIGGAGFIGSHLCDALVNSAKVICLDNYASGSVENISQLLQHPNFVFLKHDINEPIDLEKYPELEMFEVKFQGIQEVYYLACPTVQLGFEEYAVQTAKTNSVGVVNALEIAHKYQARFLLGSTHSIYGDPLEGQEMLSEDYWGFVDLLGERACYNEGKRFAETLADTYHRTFNIDTKIARIFNVYGPRMRFRSGRMIPDFIRAATNHQDLVVYGDGTTRDNYCYIDDMVQALVAQMQSSVNDPINLGSTENYPIIEIAKKIIALVGSKSNTVFAEAITGLAKLGLPDISRAKHQLGWFPMTSIDNGLKRTVENMLGSRVLTYHPVAKPEAPKHGS